MIRFWEKVQKRGPNECWPWTAARAGGRNAEYGVFRLSKPRRQVYAHRFALALHSGADDRDFVEVMHTCDNPLCCNPHHLLHGTHADNVRDMFRKGRRGQIGKLTINQAREIKQRLRAGEKVTKLAKEFGLAHSAVSVIKSGKTWKTA